MKTKFINIIPSVLVTLVLLTIAGCKKYLDVQPVSQYDIPQVFSDVSNATTALVGVYDELQGDPGYGIRISLYYPYDSDEGIVSGNLDNGRRGIGRYQLLLSNAELRNPFLQLYRGVEKANIVIEQIPEMEMYTNGTDVEKRDLRRLYGEALTLRAQFLFELIRHWGDVPAPFIPSYQQQNLYISQANRDSTYDHILADLAIAKDLVPWRTEVPRNERITKGAVKALRARIALFRGGYSLRTESKTMERRSDYKTYYQIARDECAEIMSRRDQHTLNPSFEDVWRKVTSFTMDPYGEILFEVGAGGGNANSDSRMGNYDGPSLNAASRYGAGGGGIIILPNYFYSFDTLDTRRDVTITTYQVTGSSNLKSMRRLAELTNGKYRRDWRVPLLPGTVLNPGFNWAIIRFSDVLLMFAEAENEINGPTAAAKTALEEVRKRAFKGNETKIPVTPTDKAAFFDAIVSERYLEFGTEAIRKYDLIRWNLLATKLQEARTKIVQIRDAAGPYSNVPQYIYWKNNGEEIQYYAASPFYQPTQTPSPTTG
ncbi:MAG TPA: RagB/SusD family nutrient uptake outer membrane protein [Flavitalea sp.]|nr:RagB/SusD family nutrient uptake outer membrane protein [Flavitalea sp.]